jgi:hypothetical protein
MVTIAVNDKMQITCTIRNTDSKTFYQIVSVIKMYKGSKYDPDNRQWILDATQLQAIFTALEQIGPVDYRKEKSYFLSLGNKYLQPLYPIKKEIVFPSHYLKAPPITGKGIYKDFQLEDINTLYQAPTYALFNDTGTGKSYVLWSLMHIFRKENRCKKIVYVTSSSGVWDALSKIEKFTDFSKDEIIVGSKHIRNPFDYLDKNIIICNYRSFLLISDYYAKLAGKTKKARTTAIPVETWLQGDAGCIILDESHNIAHYKARQTKALHHIKKFFKYRYIATGTPADKEEKYYSQLAFLNPSLVRNWGEWEWKNYYIEYQTDVTKAELQTIVKNNCVRRIASEVLELPEHHVKPLFINLTDKHFEIYKSFAQAYFLQKFGSRAYFTYNKLYKCMPALMFALDYPQGIKAPYISKTLVKEIESFHFEKHHKKVEILQDILSDYPDEKIIIWTIHPATSQELATIFVQYNPIVINGTLKVPSKMTKDEYKQQLVDEFRLNPERKMLIAGTQVLNSAITITESFVQVFFELDVTYTNVKQAIARIYRIGQNNDVHTFYLVANRTLDITRYELMQNNDFVNEKFLSEEYIDAKTVQDILFGTFQTSQSQDTLRKR